MVISWEELGGIGRKGKGKREKKKGCVSVRLNILSYLGYEYTANKVLKVDRRKLYLSIHPIKSSNRKKRKEKKKKTPPNFPFTSDNSSTRKAHPQA